MQRIKLFLKLCMSLSLLCLVLLQPVSIHAQDTQGINKNEVAEPLFKQRLTALIEQWQVEISKDEQYGAFEHAQWEVSALGPGSHSFLVLFFSESQEKDEVIGYVIIVATPTGELQIGEYGKGLYESLVLPYESPLLTLYHHPLEAIYVNENNEAIDLFTNETYPIEISAIKKAKPTEIDLTHDLFKVNQQATFNYAHYTNYFSPYDKLPWLTSKPINSELIEDRAIETDIELDSQLYYRVKSWDNAISTVFAITGFHKWNDNLIYIGIQLDDEQSIRFIPYEHLLKYGTFYSS